MDVRWILGGSVLLQILATFLALRLIKITGWRAAWSLIAAAIALMAVRRAFSLYDTLLTDASPPHGMEAEVIALSISTLMLLGLALIAPLFRAMRDSELGLRDAHEKLEEHVRGRTDELTLANATLEREAAERAEVEQALRASEVRFRTVSETIAAAVFIYRGTDVIDVNPAACAMSGYSRDELLRMKFWEVLHPDFQAMVKERGLARQAGDKVASSYEVKIRRKDGEDRWLSFTAARIEYLGEPAIIGTGYDISRLKSVEDALREVDAHQKLIFQTVPMVVYTAEPTADQFVVWMSEQAEQITGFPPRRFLQRDGFWAGRIHPEDVDRVLGIFADLPNTEAAAFEYRWKCAGGEYRWFLEHPTFLRDADGRPSEIIGTWVDIHERKTAEEALIESEQRVQAIIDNTTAVIYVKDLQGRYQLTNRQYKKLFNVDRQDAVGKTDFDFFPSEIAEAFRANDKTVLKADRQIQFEEIAPHADGPHTYVSLKFPLYDGEGHQAGLCGISTDITERKRFEADLHVAKDAAEAASRAKSRFLANISHEIRTPITAMLGAAEQIQSTQVQEQAQLRRADMILRNGRHLLALVNDLLDASRLEAGKLEIRPGRCSLLEILTDVAAITQMSDLPEGVAFKIALETDIPETIYTDRTRVTQAIANIVGNARKFTRRGHIHVRVQASRDPDDACLRIAVEDTGPGVADADRDRIFEVFTKGETPEQPSLKGAGIGLSLSRWIAEQLGGSLELQSSSEAGSTFVLRIATGDVTGVLWLSSDEAARRLGEGLPPDETQAPLLHGSVLLAEDVEDTRTLIDEALTAAGATVTVAVDGQDAVDRFLENGAFDLILLDIRMPRMDGLAAGRVIRERGYRSAMIALTASTTAAERDRILAAGFDDVWTKPIPLDHLIQNANAFLESKARVTEDRPTTGDGGKIQRTMAQRSEDFRRALPDRIKAIRTAAEEGKLGRYRDLLHQLLGSAGIHGLDDVSQAAASLMMMLDRSGTAAAPADLERLTAMAEPSSR